MSTVFLLLPTTLRSIVRDMHEFRYLLSRTTFSLFVIYNSRTYISYVQNSVMSFHVSRALIPNRQTVSSVAIKKKTFPSLGNEKGTETRAYVD